MIQLPKNAFSQDNIYKAYLKCRKGKRGAINTMGFEVNLFENIQYLSENLQNGTYQPTRSILFYFQKPKLREIFAADFRDRVVHRLLVDILEPHYEKSFIKDSYACRKEKGTHGAVECLKEFVKNATSNGRKAYYYLQLDIKGFFMQIHKGRMFEILKKKIQSPPLLQLCETIIFNDPTQNYVLKGNAPQKGKLPPHKTMFHKDKGRGIPIGNLTSQFFANVYLNELDQYAKRNLAVKCYVRYVDDFILLSNSKTQLEVWKEKIQSYLDKNLYLKLKNTGVEPISVYKGIDFLGYFIKPKYTLVRRRVVKNFQRALSETLPPKPKERGIWVHQNFYPDWDVCKLFQSKINSYLGHFSKANSHNLISNFDMKIKHLQPFIQVKGSSVRFYPNKPDRFRSYRKQILYHKYMFSKKIVLVQIGKFFEFLGEREDVLAFELGIRPFYRNSMRMYGFHYKYLNRFIALCQKFYIDGVLLKEMNMVSEKIKVRIPVYIWYCKEGTQLELFR